MLRIVPMVMTCNLMMLAAPALAQVDVQGSSGARVHVDANGNAVIHSSSGRVTQATRAGAVHSRASNRAGHAGNCGHLEISGMGQKITPTCVSTDVEVSGMNNVLHLRVAPGATINVSGTGNTVIWTPADPKGAPPAIDNSGTNNTVRRG